MHCTKGASQAKQCNALGTILCLRKTPHTSQDQSDHYDQDYHRRTFAGMRRMMFNFDGSFNEDLVLKNTSFVEDNSYNIKDKRNC